MVHRSWITQRLISMRLLRIDCMFIFGGKVTTELLNFELRGFVVLAAGFIKNICYRRPDWKRRRFFVLLPGAMVAFILCLRRVVRLGVVVGVVRRGSRDSSRCGNCVELCVASLGCTEWGKRWAWLNLRYSVALSLTLTSNALHKKCLLHTGLLLAR